MLTLLLACTGPGEDPLSVDPFAGSVSFTVDKPDLGPELVELPFVGFSQIAEDDFAVLTANDDGDVWELELVLPDFDGAGDYVPSKVRYRKGEQHLLDGDAACTVQVTDAADADQPYAGTFSCEGLTTEEDSEPWTLRDGSFSGGFMSTPTTRGEGLAQAAWVLGVELVSGPLEGELVTHEDPARAIVIPWRGDWTWVLFEDGGDESLDDAMIKVLSEPGGVTLRKRVRALTSEEDGLQLHVEASEELELGVEGREETLTGSSLTLELWESLQDPTDELRVLIR